MKLYHRGVFALVFLPVCIAHMSSAVTPTSDSKSVEGDAISPIGHLEDIYARGGFSLSDSAFASVKVRSSCPRD